MTIAANPSTVEQITAELTECNWYAKRQQRVLGTPEMPTKWDEAHGLIDLLLDDWRAATDSPAPGNSSSA